MSRLVRTARGELVDFDTIIIKQKLANAPMNIEVEQRKRFIDSKEQKPKRTFIDHNATGLPTMNVVIEQGPVVTEGSPSALSDAVFEPEAPAVGGRVGEPVPELPVRTKKA